MHPFEYLASSFVISLCKYQLFYRISFFFFLCVSSVIYSQFRFCFYDNSLPVPAYPVCRSSGQVPRSGQALCVFRGGAVRARGAALCVAISIVIVIRSFSLPFFLSFFHSFFFSLFSSRSLSSHLSLHRSRCRVVVCVVVVVVSCPFTFFLFFVFSIYRLPSKV